MQRDHKQAERWTWLYRDSTSGQIRQTAIPLTEEQAASLPEAQRIEGSMSFVEMEDADFPETGPEVHSIAPEEWVDRDQSSET